MSTFVTFPQLQTPRKVQRTLGVNRTQLNAIVASGQLPAYHIHGVFRFKPADVEACRRAIYVSCFNPCDVC